MFQGRNTNDSDTDNEFNSDQEDKLPLHSLKAFTYLTDIAEQTQDIWK